MGCSGGDMNHVSAPQLLRYSVGDRTGCLSGSRGLRVFRAIASDESCRSVQNKDKHGMVQVDLDVAASQADEQFDRLGFGIVEKIDG